MLAVVAVVHILAQVARQLVVVEQVGLTQITEVPRLLTQAVVAVGLEDGTEQTLLLVLMAVLES
jgi:hypothetical protein